MIVLAVDSASNVTDWLSAWGQIAGAVATFAAVVVALWIAVRDERRIEQNRLDEAHGEAAMAVAEMRRDASPRLRTTAHVRSGNRRSSTLSS
jgi:hypothetical protein